MEAKSFRLRCALKFLSQLPNRHATDRSVGRADSIRPACSVSRGVRALVCFVFMVAILNAQHHHEMVTSGSIAALPGSIDGSKNPELIPDSTAYRIYFGALTVDSDQKRQMAMIEAAHLSAADSQAVLSAAGRFSSMHQLFVNEANAAASTATRTGMLLPVTQLLSERENLGLSVMAMLQASLSARGLTQFRAFVQSKKKNIVLFSEPSMSLTGEQGGTK